MTGGASVLLLAVGMGVAVAALVASVVEGSARSRHARRVAATYAAELHVSSRADAGVEMPGPARALLAGLLAVVAGLALALLFGALIGGVAALAAGLGSWRWMDTDAPARVRQRVEEAALVEELPHLMALVATGARRGAPVETALAQACAALPGPAAQRLEGALAALEMGIDPQTAWEQIAAQESTAAVGRLLARSAVTGAGVVEALETVADDLAAARRSAQEEAARSVGVKAAVPLGLCLLPAFVLLGIVPLVAGLLAQMEWS